MFTPKQLIMPLSLLLLHELRYKRTSDHFFSLRPWCGKLKKKCSKKQHVWLVSVICLLNLVQWSVTQVLGHVLLGGELEILSVSVLGLLYCSTDKCNWITVVHYFGAHIGSYCFIFVLLWLPALNKSAGISGSLTTYFTWWSSSLWSLQVWARQLNLTDIP